MEAGTLGKGMPVKKVMVAGLQLHCVEAGQVVELLQQQLAQKNQAKGNRTSCFLSFSTLLLSLLSVRLRKQLRQLELLCPGSALMRWACSRLAQERGQPRPKMPNPFQLIVSTLTALNNRGGSVFLLGDSRRNLERAEAALLRSFPQLSVLGRYHGRGAAYDQKRVLLTVKKCSPDILLVGKGRFYQACLEAQAGQAVSICYRPIMWVFAHYHRPQGKRVNFLRRSSSPLAFLLPWSWLKLPFALAFSIYVLILESRKARG